MRGLLTQKRLKTKRREYSTTAWDTQSKFNPTSEAAFTSSYKTKMKGKMNPFCGSTGSKLMTTTRLKTLGRSWKDFEIGTLRKS